MWAFHERDTLAGVWLKIIDRQRNDWPVVFRRFLQENQRLAPRANADGTSGAGGCGLQGPLRVERKLREAADN